jgi:hypothetical protein
LAIAGCLAWLSSAPARAPAATAEALGVQDGANVPPFAPVHAISLEHVARAMTDLDHSLLQVRRVRDRFRGEVHVGGWVGVRELQRQQAATSSKPARFGLEFLGFEHRPIGEAERRALDASYSPEAEFLIRFQSFFVSDVKRAASHYRLHYVGEAVRAQRPAYRVAAVSIDALRPSWLLDLDFATGYPLYRGEFTPAGELVAEVEVLAAVLGTKLPFPDGPWWWRPRSEIVEFHDGRTAAAAARLDKAVVPPDAVFAGGYAFQAARVVTEPITGERRLVLVYGDGIDQIFVVQRATGHVPGAGHTIAHYRSSGITHCQFVHAGVEFLLCGRATGDALKAAARNLYRQALHEVR